MPCAITSSSSTIRTFASASLADYGAGPALTGGDLGEHLGTCTGGGAHVEAESSNGSSSSTSTRDSRFPSSAAGRSSRASSRPRTTTRPTGDCSPAGSRFADASRTASASGSSSSRRRAGGSSSRSPAAPRGCRPCCSTCSRPCCAAERPSSPWRSSAPAGPAPWSRATARRSRSCSTRSTSSTGREWRAGSPRSRPRRSPVTAPRCARSARSCAARVLAAATARRSWRASCASAPAPAPLDETEPLTRLRSLLVEQYGELLAQRPRSPPRRRLGGAAPGARRDPPRTGAAARRGRPGRARLGRGVAGGAQVAGRPARPRPRLRRPAPAPGRRGAVARARRRPRAPDDPQPPRPPARHRTPHAARSDDGAALLRPARRPRRRARRPGERRRHDHPRGDRRTGLPALPEGDEGAAATTRPTTSCTASGSRRSAPATPPSWQSRR